MMDHAGAHERIADLALEPGGLAAALTTDGSGDRDLAEHVAGCELCQADIAAWRGVQATIRRSLEATGPDGRADIDPIEPGDVLRRRILEAAGTSQPRVPVRPFRAWNPRVPQMLLGLAAALVVAVAGTFLLAGPVTDLSQQVGEARALTGVVTAVDRILAESDHRVVALTTPGGQAGGSVAWGSHDLVVLASALEVPPSGSVYRCWLVGGDQDTAVGRMQFAGGTAYWVGSLDEWASISLKPGTEFYVTLETGPPGSMRAGPVILEGTL
jgi:hypothetical protein